jgi:hypothetical protein
LTQPTGAPVSAQRKPRRRFRFLEHLQTNTAAIVVATLFALLCGSLLFHDPARLPALTIDNPSRYDVKVDVSGDNGSTWTVLTTARQSCAATVESPVDRGDRWLFRVRAQGLVSSEIAVDRSDLERGNWHFAVPADIAQQWETSGVPHPPRQSC